MTQELFYGPYLYAVIGHAWGLVMRDTDGMTLRMLFTESPKTFQMPVLHLLARFYLDGTLYVMAIWIKYYNIHFKPRCGAPISSLQVRLTIAQVCYRLL